MTPVIILGLVAQYGPQIIPLVQKLVALAEGGNKTLTSADMAELIALGQKTSDGYLKAAGISMQNGVVVPAQA